MNTHEEAIKAGTGVVVEAIDSVVGVQLLRSGADSGLNFQRNQIEVIFVLGSDDRLLTSYRSNIYQLDSLPPRGIAKGISQAQLVLEEM